MRKISLIGAASGWGAGLRATEDGPAAVNSSSPTFTKPTRPDNFAASSSAESGSERSAATISGFGDTIG